MTYHRSINNGSATCRDRLRNRLSCACTGPVVAVSEERRQNYIHCNRVKPRRVICIPNGTDVERFRSCPATRAIVRQQLGIVSTDVVVGAAGHFGHEKGLDIVLQAFRRILGLIPNNSLKLLILGDGHNERRVKLEQLAAACEGCVTFLGLSTGCASLVSSVRHFSSRPTPRSLWTRRH